MSESLVKQYFTAHLKQMESVDKKLVSEGINYILNAFMEGKKIFTCGNGEVLMLHLIL